MADSALITRRAAFVGAIASTAPLAAPVAAAVKPSTLGELAAKFRDDAQAIDPTIVGCFVGYDETIDGPRETRVMHIFFERKHVPFKRRRSNT